MSEEKDSYSESKRNEDSLAEKKEVNSKELVEKIEAYFYTDDALAAEFEAFVSSKAHLFTDVAHVDEIKEVEYKLDYTQVYNEYKALFELKIESFIESQGVSVAEFFEIIQEKTNLDADCSEAFFGQMLLAVTEFDVFMVMMKEAAQAKTPYDPDAAAAMLTPSDESKSDPIVTNISDAKADSK